MPPLAGFMGKWQVFGAGLATDNVALWLLVVFAALNSLLALGYYLPLVNRLYRQTPAPALLHARALPLAMTAPLVVLALLLLLFGLFPDLLASLTGAAGDAVQVMFGGAG
jgi:NADH:ubiquinone oxidoreductase subunit 2 (subunit N)